RRLFKETYVVGSLEDEEMNDPENSEDEREESEEMSDIEMPEVAPTKRIKRSPKKVQGKAKEKDEKTQANLAKVLKAKGRNKKAVAVAKTSNSDAQPSKPSGSKQKMLDVILSGLSTMDGRKGVSLPALKKYILEDETSNASSWERVRPKIKAAIEQGIQEELIVRPKGSENVTGLQGSFKLNKAKYASKNSNVEKQNTKAKDSSSTKMSKTETIKKSSKIKSKEAENLPKKTVGNIRHRRSVSEDFRLSEWKTKKLKKSRSMEEIPDEPKKKLQKVKKKTTPKKKSSPKKKS
ncbi:Sperm-specific protein PHI-2B, partial [Armadillidium nasatum]